MTKSDHLANDLLVRAIDDELSGAESVLVESHLAHCEQCRQSYQDLRLISARVESLVTATPAEFSDTQRDLLARELYSRESSVPAPHAPEKVLRRFGWGMAIAATLAIGIMLAPRAKHPVVSRSAATLEAQSGGSFDVDGETFIALPYSNPDLPMSSPHIVQMQVPVSSLMDAGIMFEPISSQVAAPDRSVLADVLLGIDGQPLGVHVIGAE